MNNQKKCKHENVTRPDFDLNEAKTMGSHMVRMRFPRYQTECPDCGEFLTVYHSPEHRKHGAW